jgi:hypothetical protein
VQKSAGKVLASISWDQDGVVLVGYLPKGQTINAERFSSLLVCLYIKNWPEDGSLEPKHVASYVLMTVYTRDAGKSLARLSAKLAGKVLASISWDQDGIHLVDYLPKGQTINAECYSSLPVWSL